VQLFEQLTRTLNGDSVLSLFADLILPIMIVLCSRVDVVSVVCVTHGMYLEVVSKLNMLEATFSERGARNGYCYSTSVLHIHGSTQSSKIVNLSSYHK
jgi:hypothetical protein